MDDLERDGEKYMNFMIYDYDLYDLVDISTLEVGSIIELRGNEVEVKELERLDTGLIFINGGLEMGGYDLFTNENGVYFESLENDYKVFKEVGVVELKVSPNFVFTDNMDLDNMGKTYNLVSEFKRKYPMTIAWRLKSHCKVIDKHLGDDEKVIYAFAAQKNHRAWDIFYTNVIVLTDKRILVATKRVLWGYYLVTITPDMFSDLTVRKGLIFGSVLLDTIKEKVVFSNIDPNALPEIESIISEYMMEQKRVFVDVD